MKLLCVLHVFWLLLSGGVAAIQAALKSGCSNEVVPSVSPADIQVVMEGHISNASFIGLAEINEDTVLGPQRGLKAEKL